MGGAGGVEGRKWRQLSLKKKKIQCDKYYDSGMHFSPMMHRFLRFRFPVNEVEGKSDGTIKPQYL